MLMELSQTRLIYSLDEFHLMTSFHHIWSRKTTRLSLAQISDPESEIKWWLFKLTSFGVVCSAVDVNQRSRK